MHFDCEKEVAFDGMKVLEKFCVTVSEVWQKSELESLFVFTHFIPF